ncbi:transcriptional regulator [Sinobaca qinghaiensis]|uniref:HTH-type transcriptional regulator n=1 Tax=Sinobaca qinghaiensis TaxID=342944 RepID=A0A419V8S8_9BACL|nr:GbsR/MarR family transcriptional regulator [Sinobaca qinghaiensis]RKD76482.1 transcriptional regulator [Sinobaca qinghaiensis]
MDKKGELPVVTQVEQIRHQFISVIAQNMGLYNISETNGRLYGTVLFAGQPMTLDEMSDALSMSKMSMSTGIRSLMDASMVERVWEKGVRKDLYQTEQDWYKSFTSVFITRWREATDNNHQAALQALKDLRLLLSSAQDEDIQMIHMDIEKLEGAVEYYEWLDEVILIFESGKIFEWVPRRPS